MATRRVTPRLIGIGYAVVVLIVFGMMAMAFHSGRWQAVIAVLVACVFVHWIGSINGARLAEVTIAEVLEEQRDHNRKLREIVAAKDIEFEDLWNMTRGPIDVSEDQA